MVMHVPSKTDRRQEMAARRLPTLVDEIRTGKRPLDTQSVTKLYREVRALTRNKPPMHMRTGEVKTSTRLLTRGEILEKLLDAQSLTRTDLIDLFKVLEATATHDQELIVV